MEAAIFFQSLRENLRLKRLLPWIGIGILCGVFGNYWHVLQESADQTEQYSRVSSIFVFHVLALMSAILVSTIVSQEIEQKTIVYLITRPVPRWKLLFFRYLACALAVVTLSVFDAFATSVGVYHGVGGNLLFWHDVAALIVGAFAYCALFSLIGLLFNRAMIICLLFAFGWETAVPNMPGQMCYLSINSYLQAISEHTSAGQNGVMSLLSSSLGDNTLTSSTAYMSMAAFVVVLVAVGAWWFSTFEYLPRDDAE